MRNLRIHKFTNKEHEVELIQLFNRATWVDESHGWSYRDFDWHGLTFRSRRAFCQDCEMDRPEGYMVHNRVWAEAGLETGICCLACLKERLGRDLVLADFTHAPINDLIFLGASLKEK